MSMDRLGNGKNNKNGTFIHIELSDKYQDNS